MPLMVTVRPTTSVEPNNSVAVSEPRTVTAATSASSWSVRKRPAASVLARTSSQDGDVPTTVVVQFVLPAVNDNELFLIGATALTSGAATEEASADASLMVSV